MGQPWLIGEYVPKRWAMTGSLRPVVYARDWQDHLAWAVCRVLRSPSGLLLLCTLSLAFALSSFVPDRVGNHRLDVWPSLPHLQPSR
jgi:hypothetical protein